MERYSTVNKSLAKDLSGALRLFSRLYVLTYRAKERERDRMILELAADGEDVIRA